ncbi:MAG: DUF6457 domain-containing protein [Actinomycetota bacterium]
MEPWIDRLAQALGSEPLAPTEQEALLEAAREVAHGVERRVTPLSTFLVGVAVGRRKGTEPRDVSLTEALDVLRRAVEGEAGARES